MEETLNTIKRRYIHERAIYTWCGIALVAVNPYQEQDIYGEQAVETYHSASHSVYLQLDPHIYAVTEDAYSKLERNLRNQSIIVSGESGAGKTVSAKHAMRYLASIASSKSKLQIENRVLASNPIMEAIGNASTMRNDNSSRFGKYIQIFFQRHNRKILGGNMRTYLLEKSRVTKQQAGERNFHIFYQLLNFAYRNPTKLAHLKLLELDEGASPKMRQFSLLAGQKPLDSRDDLKRFNESLKTLNIDQERIDVIYRIIAGILHGGNIRFEKLNAEEENEHDQGCRIDRAHELHFRACCDLLGLCPVETERCLTRKLLKTGPREVIEQPLSRVKAEHARDAMLKDIYERLFSWLVGLINLSLGSARDNNNRKLLELEGANSSPANVLKSPSSKGKSILDHQMQEPQFIGVLDIYGFENFKTNSFEQFCINYANEVLQQQYNQHVFKLEQEEYMREGIDWTFIEYSDNQPVIDIIESRPIGILNLLDEECRMPKGTDESWCAKLFEHLLNPAAALGQQRGSSDSAVFKKPKLNYQSSFCVNHYAEEVVYQVATFLEKNRDTICEEQSALLRASQTISYIFEDPLLVSCSPTVASNKQSSGLRNSKFAGQKVSTVGFQFRGSLAALIRTLNDTEPHYIRCIKPNDEKRAFEFNEERAVQQLKACGVYETIRISNNGFPSRWLYRDFAKRYSVLIYGTEVFEKLASESRQRQLDWLANNQQAQDKQSEKSLEEDNESCEQPDSLEGVKNGVDNDEEEEEKRKLALESSRFMRNFSSQDVKPICDAICQIAYEQGSVYEHLRTKEEQSYLNQLKERHGDKPGAIYQFGKSKIFFRAGQVGYLERIRGQKIRGYTITIQRHIRGWIARRSFAKRREEHLEQLRREASLVSLQNQVTSLQTELEQVKEEKIEPLIIGAILEYEALDQPDPFVSFDRDSARSLTPNNCQAEAEKHLQSMELLIKKLNKFHDLIVKNSVPEDVAIQAFKQVFYLICAQSLNQLLIRRDLCQFRKAMQISFNLSCLVQWCRERFLVKWREIVEQLDPITQATKLLQTRKSSEDIATIEEVCNKLRPSQIIKILNMYTSSYEEQITIDFIHELEAYLNKIRATLAQPEVVEGADVGEDIASRNELSSDEDSGVRFDSNNNNNSAINNNNNNNNDLLMDTKKFFQFVDEELESQ